MLKAITVSQYNQYIKQIFEAEELLHNVSIIGEVFGISLSRNVTYFSLKDENSAISCVCFYPELFKNIQEGDKVTITGSPNYYMKNGKLSFNVAKLELAGQGDLYKQFMALKEKLEREGLFDQEHKKAIPQDIRRIGVITSKEGAVIHDIINVSHRRNPSIDILYFPTKVQGKGAENEIAHAIEMLSNYDKIDVIVVARGGGSLEDLWAYNTEVVARATYNCEKPIVSAVGHETDFTIIDFVSDLRAPTPSAAAELLTKEVKSQREMFNKTKREFLEAMDYYYYLTKSKLNYNVNAYLGIIERLSQLKIYEFDLLENSLLKLDPMAVLKRGYAKLEQKQKQISSINDLDKNEDIEVYVVDGKIIATPKIFMEE